MTNKKILNFNSKLNSKERFGLRKLSIGLAAVCLGTSFVLLNNQTTYAADEKTPAVQTETAASLNKEENPPAADKSATSTTQVATSTPKTSSSHTETKAEAQPAPQSSVKDANSKKDTTPVPKVAATKQDQPATPAKAIPAQAAPIKTALSSTNINDTNNVTVYTNNTSDMMANNTRGSVHVNVKNAGVYQTNDQAKISISNPDNLLNFNNNSPSLGDDFSTSTDGQGTFTFTYQGKTTSSFSDLNLDLSFTGNNDAVKTYIAKHGQDPTNIPVNISLTLPNASPINKDFAVTIHPYADKVQQDELMHGFIIGPKVIWTPINSTNTRTEDGTTQVEVGVDQNGQAVYVDQNQGKVQNSLYIEDDSAYSGPETSAALDIPQNEQNSARLMQYGIDWNFGGLNPVDNVLATINVTDGQTILPHTIKVFRVVNPADIKNSDGTRTSINDSYNDITNYDPATGTFINEDGNFEELLRNSILANGQNITIDQKGPFTVNSKDYSKNGAYFIQFDTKLDMSHLPNWQVKGNGPGITTPIHNERNWNVAAQGDNTSSQIFTGFNKASIDPGNPVPENITVYYISENTGKEISTPATYTGSANGVISNHTLLDIDNLTKKGYIFDESATLGENPHIALPDGTYNPRTQNFALTPNNVNVYNATNLAFDNDTNPNNQIYYVYFYQKATPVTRTITAQETINYIYGNGPHKSEVAANPVLKTLTFTNHGTSVNGISTWDENWSSDNGFEFSDVYSPTIIKYNPETKQVAKITLTNGDLTKAANQNQSLHYTFTVTYYTNENASLTFYDDTDNVSLSSFLTKNGQESILFDQYNKQDDNSTKTPIQFKDADEIVNFLESKHYIFKTVTGQGSNGATKYNQVSYGNFNNDPDHDQAFVLHFVHETNSVSQAKSVNETINYIYGNGPKKGQEAAPTYKATQIKFTQNGIQDLVSGNTKWDAWTPASNQFKEVVSPKVDHYTADKLQIDAQTVTPESKDLSYIVYYSMIEEPDKPNTPDKPSTPEKPTQPVQPTQPTTPNEPKAPKKPIEPTTPNTPSIPQPSTPDTPSNPQPSQPDSNNVPQSQNKPKDNTKRAKTPISIPHSSSKQTPVSHQPVQRNIKNKTLHNNSTLTKTTITTHPHFAKTLPTSHINSTPMALQSKHILPQTGEKENSLTILGLALATLAGILGLSIKKHKN